MTEELGLDQIPQKDFQESIEQENVWDFPILNSPTIKGGNATFGSGNNCLKFNEEDGLWAGNADFASAPFRVSLAGVGTLSGGMAVGTNAWHVDSSGNMWWGSSSTYAGATVKISSAGDSYLRQLYTGDTGANRIQISTSYIYGINSSNVILLQLDGSTGEIQGKYLTLDEVSAPTGVSNEGKLYVGTDNLPYYKDESNVAHSIMLGTISSPADNEVFAYNSGTSTWINQTAAEAGLLTTSYSPTKIYITTTDVTFADTTTETTLITCTIPGGTLGTNNGIHFKLFFSDIDKGNIAASTIRFEVNFGGTAGAITSDTGGFNITDGWGIFEGYIFANGATDSQEWFVTTNIIDSAITDGEEKLNLLGASSGDSTGDLTLLLTAKYSVANATNGLTMCNAFVERIN